MEQIETIILTNKDRDLVLSALENPPEPNEALKKLFTENNTPDNLLSHTRTLSPQTAQETSHQNYLDAIS